MRARARRIGLEPAERELGVLAREARVLRGDPAAGGAMAAGAGRNADGLDAAAPDLLAARASGLVARHLPGGLLALEVGADVAHVLGAEARGHALHDRVGARARLERGELRGDVVAVLAGELPDWRRGALLPSAPWQAAHTVVAICLPRSRSAFGAGAESAAAAAPCVD